MLEFKTLTLEDKNLFDSYIKPYKFLTSEFSFTTLFIWRKGLDIQYTIYKDALIIKKYDFDGKSHFMQPIGYKSEDLKEIVENLQEYKKIQKMDYLFKDAETPFIEKLKSLYSENLNILEDRDNFDYLYESEKLINLSGKKLHSKKNHYNNFIKNNHYRVEPLTDETIQDCINTAKEWCNKSDCKGYLLYESKAIEELLKNKASLDFEGIVVYVSDKLSAFTIGEKVTEDMAIIHIEKADTTINGLYTFINKSFIEAHFSAVSLINREQDLGIEGLRKAKLSYQPIKLEPKYAVNFIE